MGPMAGNPEGIEPGAHLPMPRNPNPMTVSIHPVTLNPNMRCARRDSNNFLARTRRCFSYYHLPSTRGCNDRFISAPGVTPAQQKASKRNYSRTPNGFLFHTILLFFRADFLS